MKHRIKSQFQNNWPVITIFLIWIVFFWKFLFLGKYPFPGDLLVTEYQPWKSESYLGYLPGTMPHKAQYFDVLRQLYPWRKLGIDMMKKGEWPLWNPYNFSGSPLLANHQSALLYPLNIVFFLPGRQAGLLPFPLAWSLLVSIQPFLASLFMYAFARVKKISKPASVIAGIIFGYSLFSSVFLEYNTIIHTYLWIPLILYAAEKRFLFLFAFGIFSLATGGHLQTFVVSLLFIILYLYILTRTRELFMTLFITLGVTSVQFLPTLELIRNSARENLDYSYLINTLLVQPKELLLLAAPDLFGNPVTRNYTLSGSYPGRALYTGILPLILIAPAIKFIKTNKMLRFLSMTIILILLLITKNPVTVFLYRIPIPFFSTASPTNMFFLYTFCIAIISAMMLDRIRISSKHFLLPASLLAISYVYHETQMYLVTLVFIATAVLVLKKNTITTILLIVIVAGNFFYYFQKFNPFVDPSLIYPETKIGTWLTENAGYDRFWGYGNARIEANFATIMRTYSPDGYDPLYPAWYKTLLTGSTRSDAIIEPGFGETNMMQNLHRLSLLRKLGIRYILDRTENGSTQNTFPPENFSLVDQFNGWKIFEYKKVLPRAYTTSSPAVISSYSPLKKSFTVTAGDSTEFILSDTWYPGWTALVDNDPVYIEKYSDTLQKIPLLVDDFTITLQYRPKSFIAGGTISIISVCLLFVYAFYLRHKT